MGDLLMYDRKTNHFFFAREDDVKNAVNRLEEQLNAGIIDKYPEKTIHQIVKEYLERK